MIVLIIANEVGTAMMLFLALIPKGLSEVAGAFGCVPHLTASWDTGTVVASGKQEKNQHWNHQCSSSLPLRFWSGFF